MRFRDLPGFPPLFMDFVDNYPEARALLPERPSPEILQKCALEAQRRSLPRLNLSRLLAEKADDYQSGARTRENIERLADAETVAVLTVAPVNLFGGPLSVILKCLSAAKLASTLESRGIPAVPVCWIDACAAGNAAVKLLDSQSKMHTLALELPSPASGDWTVPDGIGALIEQIERLASGPDIADIVRLSRETYIAGAKSSIAVGRFLSALMEEWGMVIVDPSRREFGAFADRYLTGVSAGAPMMDAARVETLIREQQVRLAEAGYALPQYGAGSVPSSGHKAVTPMGNGDETCLSGHRADGSLAASILREAVLPVAAHVADPGEMANLVSILPVFDECDIPRPLVWPRVSGTIIDARSRKILEKHVISFQDLFAGKDPLLRSLWPEEKAAQTLEHFDNLMAEFETRLEALASNVSSKDRLENTVASSRAKILYQLGKLKGRFAGSCKIRREAAERQVERLCNSLAPLNMLQERQLSALHFVLRYSRVFMGLLYERMDVMNFEHQIISID